jgi:hypothetical protein
MKFIVIFGPPAVGKMTVGYELARLTGFKLFHNHMTIDLVLNFFDFTEPQFGRLVSEFRRRIFEEISSSNLEGFIFTYVWALDDERDKEYVEKACDIFRQKGGDIYFIELEAELKERLLRNESEFRLSQKPPKRDIGKSKEQLLLDETKYKMNSNGDCFYAGNYLKLNNTDLSPNEAVQRIMKEFHFSTLKAQTSANKAPQSTPTSVTAPAVAGARASGAPGSP